MKSGESLGLLLARPLYLLEDMPELARYLAAFPRGRPAATEEYLCWSKEKVWRKRVLALDHVVVHERHEDGAFRIVAAAKRIYASHCFESSLQLLALEGSPGADENTLVHLSRTRADIRPSRLQLAGAAAHPEVRAGTPGGTPPGAEGAAGEPRRLPERAEREEVLRT